jgi:hypothetical protein
VAAAAKKRGGKADTDAPAPVPEGLRLAWMSPQELAENPSNWRVHPPAQVAALTDSLAEVGWAGALLWNATTGRLIDGHARRKLALEQGAPRAQERKILATLDPIGALAEPDPKALEALLREVNTGSESLQSLLSSLAQDAGITPPDFAPVGQDEQGRLDEKAKVTCPHCGEEFTP